MKTNTTFIFTTLQNCTYSFRRAFTPGLFTIRYLSAIRSQKTHKVARCKQPLRWQNMVQLFYKSCEKPWAVSALVIYKSLFVGDVYI